MFGKLSSLFTGVQQRTQREIAESFDFSGNPFAKAVALMGSREVDESAQFLKEADLPTDTNPNPSMQEALETWAVTITNKVTFEAMHANDVQVFFPYEPVPNHAPLIVAFTGYVLNAINQNLKSEGYELDASRMFTVAAGGLFTAHAVEDKVKEVQRGANAFKAMARSDHPKARDWAENLSKLVSMYLMQETSTQLEFKKIDFPRLFGQLMNSLLKAAN